MCKNDLEGSNSLKIKAALACDVQVEVGTAYH